MHKLTFQGLGLRLDPRFDVVWYLGACYVFDYAFDIGVGSDPDLNWKQLKIHKNHCVYRDKSNFSQKRRDKMQEIL